MENLKDVVTQLLAMPDQMNELDLELRKVVEMMSSPPKQINLKEFATQLLATPERINELDVKLREELYELMSTPKQINIPNSSLRFYVHSVTEDSRIRKFKETWTIEWLQNLPNEAVLYDIGANIGITSLIPVESSQQKITVVAIEPAPSNFASLVKNIELNGFGNNVYALPIGIGAETDIACFNLTTYIPGGAMHSFGEIVQAKKDQIHKAIGSHRCLRTRLDDLVNWKGLPFPTHIKIDIDGGERELLMGATQVINDKRCKAIQIEVVDNDETHARSSFVVDLLTQAGFIMKARYDHKNTYPRITDIQFSRT